MLRGSASPGRARPPIEPPVAQPPPAQLWLLRNRRNGQWIKPHQEGVMVHRDLLVTCASREAAEAAVRFYSHFTMVDPEPVQVL